MFYAGSAVLIMLLVVVNLALVGYDEVTVTMPDPNITEYDQWWAPKSLPSALKFRTKPGDCQEVTLPLNTALRTNSSLPLFTYYLTNNLNQFDSQKDSLGLRGQTPYQANPMNICRVQNMTLTMEPRILSFAVSTSLLCDPVGDPPRSRRFQTTFKRARDSRFRFDSVLDYMAYTAAPNETDVSRYQILSRDGPPKDPYVNALGAIDALATDLIHMMWMRKVTWFHINDTANQSPVPELGSMSWDSRPDSRLPTDPSRLNWGTYTEGYWYKGNYVRTINTTIVNMFLAMRDAIYLDIGYVLPENIYVNKTTFDQVIKIDPYGTELTPITWQYNLDGINTSTTLCSWGWGCTRNINTTWAQEFTSTGQQVNNISLPIVLPSPLPASVLDIVYLCPQYKLKSWGDLLVSLFTGTFTMYVTLYGIFAWLAPMLDRKRKGPQPWERYIEQQTLSPSYEIRRTASAQYFGYTPSPYSPEFEDDKKRLLDEDRKSL
ncbi:hypothetical protein RhiLY_12285 [Ceratobasidium sp. AG-Ba]|nr:hypothetical protein RhiLY_12285 [Ceratobasidium sp. AG-Ba]